jgi:hypothetical protein
VELRGSDSNRRPLVYEFDPLRPGSSPSVPDRVLLVACCPGAFVSIPDISEHEFELVLEGADLTREELVGQLYAAGLEDATLSSSGGRVLVSVARDADTFADALISAIQEAESVSGVRVLSDAAPHVWGPAWPHL